MRRRVLGARRVVRDDIQVKHERRGNETQDSTEEHQSKCRHENPGLEARSGLNYGPKSGSIRERTREVGIPPKYLLSKLCAEYDETSQISPFGTAWDGSRSTGSERPLESRASGAEFRSSVPLTATPSAETSTTSPAIAATTFPTGAIPSSQDPEGTYPRSRANRAVATGRHARIVVPR